MFIELKIVIKAACLYGFCGFLVQVRTMKTLKYIVLRYDVWGKMSLCNKFLAALNLFPSASVVFFVVSFVCYDISSVYYLRNMVLRHVE